MKFDFAIGNPPYMETTESDSSRMPPVYNFFMDAAYEIADKVELITPARFLFNAGYTPKKWNSKMLLDKHFKVLMYENDATCIFGGTEIKGGVAITYRDSSRDFGPIETFTKYQELNGILHKVSKQQMHGLDSIAYAPLNYGISETMKRDYPTLVDRLRTSAFTKLKEIFYEECPQDDYQYIQIIGLYEAKRVKRFVRAEYITDRNELLPFWNVIIPEASGEGVFGEKIGKPVIAEPGLAYLQTFVGFGKFDNKTQADNLILFLHTKFCRTLLGVLKSTHHCSPGVWKHVPLQDFTEHSDIDWSKSIHEIDQQLYRKYGLSEEEIRFIETHVKEME